MHARPTIEAGRIPSCPGKVDSADTAGGATRSQRTLNSEEQPIAQLKARNLLAAASTSPSVLPYEIQAHPFGKNWPRVIEDSALVLVAPQGATASTYALLRDAVAARPGHRQLVHLADVQHSVKRCLAQEAEKALFASSRRTLKGDEETIQAKRKLILRNSALKS
jgi:hypothetical protein